MAMQKIVVSPEAIEKEIGSMTEAEIDELPFGAIELDLDGKVLKYNRFEEDLADRKREDVTGKNFFTDVAPCTKVKNFFGVFQEGTRRKSLNEVFDFMFMFRAGAREVRIRMIYSDSPRPGVWIFVTPITGRST